ncbi:MAG TPA: thrombospondin type 3 repeat-containing protein [Thermoleophilaceae bacterium]|nr:thrombospondin type 3 repeat-containing protein [Thermoleophilaceae bacterium]
MYWNPSQEDVDQDGLGDSCDENNGGPGGGGDGDSDGDGYVDTGDNCPSAPNFDQSDIDGDGTGDACDPFDDRDADQDGVLDAQDNCPSDPNGDQGDVDGDGVGTACDNLERPRMAADCNKSGWTAFNGIYTFRSQRECVKQVPRGKDKRA